MTGYSDDLREGVIRSWQNGHKAAWIAAEYTMGFSRVKRYITRYQRLGHSRATVQKRQTGQFTAQQLSILEGQVRDHDDATVDGHTNLWNEHQVMPVSRATMGRALQKLGWTLKKRPL